MKILNLYAGLGGNRKLWSGHSITSVELDIYIGNSYKALYPEDAFICGDAHKFLSSNYKEFDFIWSSPPCQTHSRIRQFSQVNSGRSKAVYPDLTLYQEILFLKHNFKGFYIVENVDPYYEPLIKPSFILQRHLFWSNFPVWEINFEKDYIRYLNKEGLMDHHGIDVRDHYIPNKRQALRNAVNPVIGKYILDQLESYKETL